jgi:hypothetical protein
MQRIQCLWALSTYTVHDLRLAFLQMTLREAGQWPLTERDEQEYNTSLEVGETSGEAKREDLVYYLAVQPWHA